MNKYTLIFVIQWICFFSSHAQEIGNAQSINVDSIFLRSNQDSILNREIGIHAKKSGDTITLKWFPYSPALWKLSLKKGYRITRITYDSKNNIIDTDTLNQGKPIMPWTKQQLDSYFEKTKDTLAYASTGVLFPASDIPYIKKAKNNDELNFGDLIQQRDNLNVLHLFASILSIRSQVASTALGLRYTDMVSSKTEKYLYIIETLVPQESYLSNKAIIKVGFGFWEDRKPVMPNVTTKSMDKNVILSWNRMASSLDFNMFHLEKSVDEGRSWSRINKFPYLPSDDDNKDGYNPNFNYKDSIVENYVKYLYRVGGIDPFGEIVWSEPVVGFGTDKTPPLPPMNAKGENVNENEVHLSWVNPTDNTADLVGILIGRGQNIAGPFVPLTETPLAPTQTSFIDKTADPFGTNYYVIATIDTASNAAIHAPVYVLMKDSIPPTKPLNLNGKIDTLGNVVLSWEGYNQADLLGHQVLFANQKDHVFTVVTPGHLVLPIFYDSISIRTLTKKIYYKVVTFDKNFNRSPDSEILEITRPDIIAPVTPVIYDYFVSGTKVDLKWNVSTSPDVKQQNIYRREVADGNEFMFLVSLDPKISSFIDVGLQPNRPYEYVIQAVDSSGLKSDLSYPLNIRTYQQSNLTKVKNLKAIKSKDTGFVHLDWEFEKLDIPSKYIIYKGQDDKIVQYKYVDTNKYIDKNPSVSNLTYYAISIITEDGTTTDLSDLVMVKDQ